MSTPVQVQFSQLLRSTDIFARVSDDHLEFVAEVCKLVEFEAGTRIVRQGEEGNELFIIGEGRVAVIHEELEVGSEQLVTTLGPRQSFGETSLLTNSPRSATIKAMEDTICVVLARESFQSVLRRVPEVALEVCRYLAANLHHQCQLTGFRFVPFSKLVYDPDLYGLFPARLLQRLKAIPLRLEEDTVVVAMVNPYQPSAIKQLRESTPGFSIEAVVCTQEDYASFVRRNRPPEGEKEVPILAPGDVSAELCLPDGTALEPPLSTVIREALNREVHQLLIHGRTISTPREEGLESFVELPDPASHTLLHQQLTERFFSTIDEPEVVTTVLTLEPNLCHLELSRVPTTKGPRFSLSLAESRTELPGLGELFSDWKLREKVVEELKKRGRVVALAGPPLSGRSTTAYSLLTFLKEEGGVGNMMALEREPYSSLAGVPQVRMGENFEATLRACLSQQPRLMLVDGVETADLVHLLRRLDGGGPAALACLDGSQPVEELSRLAESGHITLDSLSLILHQELLPRLCPHCRVEHAPSPSVLKQLEKHDLVNPERRFYSSKGCERCYGTGVAGKTLLLEGLTVNELVREFLRAGRSASAVRKLSETNGLLVPFSDSAAGLLERGEISPASCLRFFSDIQRPSR